MIESTVHVARPELERAVTAPIDRCGLDGVGGIVRLTGEAGIGKSTLAGVAIRHATRLGLSAWSGTAGEFDRSVSFGALGSLRSTGGERLLAPELFAVRAGDAPDGLGHPGVQGHRFDAIERVLAAIEVRCQHPMLLVLDDLHWADPSSLAAVVGLAELTLTHPLVVLVSHRSGFVETDRLAADLGAMGALEIDVPPFDDDEVQALLPLLCGGAPGSSVIERAAGAAGNPFLLHELAAGLLQAGGLVERGDVIETVGRGVPPALSDVIARELQRSGREIADLLRAAAVQGGTLDVDALSAVLEVPVLQLSEPITAAVRANLLEEADDTIRFRHQLVREAVYETIPAPVRAAIHHQLATVLAQRGAPAALVGSHLIMAGGGIDDPETVERLRLAAAETAPVDPESASRFLDRAAELCRDDLALRHVIERARVEAYTAAGKLDQAQQLATWLLDTSPDEHAFTPRMRLAGLASLMGDPSLALFHLEQAASSVRTDQERASMLAASATASLLRGDSEGAHRFATEAQVLAHELGDLVGQSVSAGVLARTSMYRDEVADGVRLAERAVALADADPSGRAHEYTPCLYAGINALNADDLDLVAAMATRGTQLAVERHLGWSLPLYGALAATGAFHRGDLDQAVAEAETVLDLADRTGTTQARLWAEAMLTLSLLHIGGPEAARDAYGLLRSSFRRGGSQLGLVYGILAQARMRCAEGRVAEARAGLEATWEFLGTMGGSTRRSFLAWDRFWLAWQDDDDEAMLDSTAATQRASVLTGSGRLGASTDLMRAVARHDRVRTEAALAELAATDRPLEFAECLVRTAGTESATNLRRAIEIYDRCGATSAAQHVRELLTDEPAATQPRPLSGWDSLTHTETAVAELLAKGLTNAQIAQARGGSRRTVETHLRNIYAKLQIDGRVKLTVACAQRFDHGNPGGAIESP